MENKNIIIGPKDPKDPQSYKELLSFIKKDLDLVASKFLIILKYKKTNESLKYKEVHFRREYINQITACLSELNFQKLVNIPHEKDGCAFRIDFRYVESGKMLGLQIIEARVGSGGGYFCMSPAIVLLEEEAEKAYDILKNIL